MDLENEVLYLQNATQSYLSFTIPHETVLFAQKRAFSSFSTQGRKPGLCIGYRDLADGAFAGGDRTDKNDWLHTQHYTLTPNPSDEDPLLPFRGT